MFDTSMLIWNCGCKSSVVVTSSPKAVAHYGVLSLKLSMIAHRSMIAMDLASRLGSEVAFLDMHHHDDVRQVCARLYMDSWTSTSQRI